jgi:hypothetical protein
MQAKSKGISTLPRFCMQGMTPRSAHTGYLPFRPVLAPKSDTVLLLRVHTSPFVEVNQASAEILPARLDSLVGLPFVGTEGLGNWVVGPMA